MCLRGAGRVWTTPDSSNSWMVSSSIDSCVFTRRYATSPPPECCLETETETETETERDRDRDRDRDRETESVRERQRQ